MNFSPFRFFPFISLPHLLFLVIPFLSFAISFPPPLVGISITRKPCLLFVFYPKNVSHSFSGRYICSASHSVSLSCPFLYFSLSSRETFLSYHHQKKKVTVDAVFPASLFSQSLDMVFLSFFTWLLPSVSLLFFSELTLQIRATREYMFFPQLMYSTAFSRKKKNTHSPISKDPTKCGSV